MTTDPDTQDRPDTSWIRLPDDPEEARAALITVFTTGWASSLASTTINGAVRAGIPLTEQLTVTVSQVVRHEIGHLLADPAWADLVEQHIRRALAGEPMDGITLMAATRTACPGSGS